jgi:hypothetical protein
VDEDNPDFCSVDGVLFSKSLSVLIAYPCANERTEYEIPEGTVEIYYGAFWGCKNLTKITVSSKVTSFGNVSFAYCSALTNITYEGTSEAWEAINKVSEWNYGTGKYTVYCVDGTIEKE